MFFTNQWWHHCGSGYLELSNRDCEITGILLGNNLRPIQDENQALRENNFDGKPHADDTEDNTST